MDTAAALTNLISSSMVLEAFGFGPLIATGATTPKAVQEYVYCMQVC
jgi:hypothetical protein